MPLILPKLHPPLSLDCSTCSCLAEYRENTRQFVVHNSIPDHFLKSRSTRNYLMPTLWFHRRIQICHEMPLLLPTLHPPHSLYCSTSSCLADIPENPREKWRFIISSASLFKVLYPSTFYDAHSATPHEDGNVSLDSPCIALRATATLTTLQYSIFWGRIPKMSHEIMLKIQHFEV